MNVRWVERIPIPVPGRTPTGSANAYVIGDRRGILLDPGRVTDELRTAIRAVDVEHVLVTHAHPDHASGVAEVAAMTDVTVHARRGHERRFERVTGVTPDVLFRPGDCIPIPGGSTESSDAPDERASRTDDRAMRTITVLDAPGHSPDHVALRIGRGGPICCGDCAIDRGSVAVAAPEGDLRAYRTTLRRLHAMDPPSLLPGHGPPITTPRACLARLLAHRRRRERRILAAVQGGARSVDEILDRAYEKDVTAVEALARGTVVAHLEALSVTGHVSWDGKRVRPPGPDPD